MLSKIELSFCSAKKRSWQLPWNSPRSPLQGRWSTWNWSLRRRGRVFPLRFIVVREIRTEPGMEQVGNSRKGKDGCSESMRTQTRKPSEAQDVLGPGEENGQLWGVITSVLRTVASPETHPITELAGHLSRQAASLLLGPSFFFWSIIALQCCVISFWCITKWISCMYTSIPSFLDRLSRSPSPPI